VNVKFFAGSLFAAAAVVASLTGARLPATGVRDPGPAVTATSSHWSGYVAAAHQNVALRYVAASWTVPALNPAACKPGTSGTAEADQWAGLDNWTDSTIEQVGTGATCRSGGTVAYYAFWSMVPGLPNIFSGAVSPGDKVNASIYYDFSPGVGAYTVELTDVTTGQQIINMHLACRSIEGCPNSSAEVITSVSISGGVPPATNLADFGTVHYTGAAVTSRDGLRGTLAPSRLWSSVPVTMADSARRTLSAPSSLSSGQAFTVAWKSAS
jgi:hypothetical protein